MPADIITSGFVLWIVKNLMRISLLYNLPKIHKDRFVGDTLRLLHIVRDDDNGIFFFQMVNEFLDL
ncbi:hypothetical protein D3C77_795450 [compost metagenome]